MCFTARPRVGGRRAVGNAFHGPPPGVGASRRLAKAFVCMCDCQKVVIVSIDLTCFYWEVF